MPQESVDGSAMARDDDGLPAVVALEFAECGNHTVVKLCERLAAGEHHGIGVTVEIGSAMTRDEIVVGHAVTVGARIVLAEALANLLFVVADERRKDLGGLAGAQIAG